MFGTEEECNMKLRIVVCPTGYDRCMKTKTRTSVVRWCGNEAQEQKVKQNCADGSCEVSVCYTSHCVA